MKNKKINSSMSNYVNNIILALSKQTVPAFRLVSLIGVFLLFTIIIQCITGIMVSFSLVNDSMLITMSRSTEDIDDLYTDDFFWLHERGVDYIFIFLYLHLLRKLYFRSYFIQQESAWKSGSFMFLLIHGIIFFGLVLCCTHLSDITLKIASKIISTITLKYGSFGYWLFTDQTLNTDTTIRLMYLHYIIPFFTIFISTIHMVDMHYGYKDTTIFDNRRVTYFWFGEVVKTEIKMYFLTILTFSLICLHLFNDNEPLSYEIFMWGDLGLMTDIRFLSVAPHWYFRAYMGWLIFCPHHYIGVFGLIYYMCIIYFQPNLKLLESGYYKSIYRYRCVEHTFSHNLFFLFFLLNLIYTISYLPYGRFYTGVEGNFATTFAYLYVFTYISFPFQTFILYFLEKKKMYKAYILLN